MIASNDRGTQARHSNCVPRADVRACMHGLTFADKRIALPIYLSDATLVTNYL